MRTTTYRSARCVSAVLLALAAVLVTCRASQAAEVPFTPYGMDATPQALFYSGAWRHYGTDSVPLSHAAHNNFHDVYGLDIIPASSIPDVRELHHVLPHQTLQVLTQAIEEEQSRRAPSR